ncbi:MAG: hypothetical protein OEQ18_07360 [Gammaproteobacteria bacterium]|nr:hypothetical protein [Gammaproteobacteria bacterium]
MSLPLPLDQPAAIFFGLAVTIGIGFGVGPFLHTAVREPKQPTSLSEADWNSLTARPGSGDWLGFLERLLSFATFAVAEYVILGGWLAFKLAAKWEAWKNIGQVAPSVESIPTLIWYQARSAHSSWLLSRFLIGTLANILIGLVGVLAGVAYCRYLNWFC